jgi:hypothetical protein
MIEYESRTGEYGGNGSNLTLAAPVLPASSLVVCIVSQSSSSSSAASYCVMGEYKAHKKSRLG